MLLILLLGVVLPIILVIALGVFSITPALVSVRDRPTDASPWRGPLTALCLVASGALAIGLLVRATRMAEHGVGVGMVALTLPWAVYCVVRPRRIAVLEKDYGDEATAEAVTAAVERDRRIGGRVVFCYLALAAGFTAWAFSDDAKIRQRKCIAGWEKSSACKTYLPALHDAAYKNDLVEVRRLLDSGEDINGGAFGEGPPVLWALLAPAPDVVRELLERGASLTYGRSQGSTYFLVKLDPYAVLCGSSDLSPGHPSPPASKLLETAAVLVAAGIEIKDVTRRSESPPAVCLKNNRPELAEYLQGLGGSVESK